jgi:hypothetical protein
LEAISSTNYIINKIPYKKLDKISYDLWYGPRPSYKYI